ncbi:retrovirus-related pol polyprotein from transposon TNT 1-94 [Tanacetum coccineum]
MMAGIENAEHLFVGCTVSSQIWKSISTWWRITWVDPIDLNTNAKAYLTPTPRIKPESKETASKGPPTSTLFLRSKDETPEVLKDFLTMIQRNLQAPVISVRTDRGIEFLNKTLNAFFKEEGIEHQTSTPRTPEQNGVVERRNRTLVEVARTMLSTSKLPLFFWAEAIATAC